MHEKQLIDALYVLSALLRDEQDVIASTFKDLGAKLIKYRKKTIAEIIAENYPDNLDKSRKRIMDIATSIRELYSELREDLVPEVMLPLVDPLFEHPEITCEDILELHKRKTLFPRIGATYRGYKVEQYPNNWVEFRVDANNILTTITVTSSWETI